MKKIINFLLIIFSICIMSLLTTRVLEGDISVGVNNTFIAGDVTITNIIGIQNGSDISMKDINTTTLNVTSNAHVETLTIDGGNQYTITDTNNFLVFRPNNLIGDSSYAFVPQDPDGTQEIELRLFAKGTPGGLNAEIFDWRYNSAGLKFEFRTTAIGGGTTPRPMLFQVGTNTDQMVLDNDGFVSMSNELFVAIALGVGTIDPLARLHVETSSAGVISPSPASDDFILESGGNTGMTIYSGTSANTAINFADEDDANIGQIDYDHNINKLRLRVNDATRLSILSNGDLGIGTTNPTVRLHVIGDGNISQNLTFNNIYGEMAFHNDSLYHVVDIVTQNIYVNVTGFDGTNTEEFQTLNGFRFDSNFNALICDVSGLYNVIYSISTGNVGNNQEYEFTIAVNNILQNNTDTHRKIQASGDVGAISGGGFINCNSGDTVNLQAVNRDGVADLRVHASNVRLIRIGD